MSDSKNIADLFAQKKGGKKTAATANSKPQSKKSKATAANEEEKVVEEKQQPAQQNTAKEYESDEDAEETANIDLGAGKVKDLKDVMKEQQQAKDEKRDEDFKWDDVNVEGQKGANKKNTAPDQGFNKGSEMLGQKNKNSTGGGIQFGKGKPTFGSSKGAGQASDNIGKGKMEFPELGDVNTKNSQNDGGEKVLPKDRPSMNFGPASTAPAKTNKPVSTFDRLERLAMAGSEENKDEAPKQRPRFGGALKKNLANQKVDNTEANKDNEAHQKKLAETIIIDENKVSNKKPEERERESSKDRVVEPEFEVVTEKKRQVGQFTNSGRGGDRGGRGGRGGFVDRDETQYQGGNSMGMGRGARPFRRDDEDNEQKPMPVAPRDEKRHAGAKIDGQANWGKIDNFF